ncbi:sulfurtransferase [Candidatus Eisenbacteria bacterium]|uniref:Sulfurtransferase n=1 Tax=Eiseniibacteriota bacterium TaxID=2212470 RepID=A0ABV6YIN5_UNCEI
MPFHRYSCRLLILVAALALVTAQVLAESQPDLALDNTMDTLVTTEWLSQHLDDADLVVLDCTVLMQPDDSCGFRSVCGRANYESGHIPTAGFADLMGALCDVDSPLNHTLPTPKQFCAAMGALGVGDDSRVVLYDGNYSVWAARVWWMLRWVGFDRAAVLDGGLGAWTAEGRLLSTELANHQTKQLTPIPRPALIADREEVLAAINDDAVLLMDTMPEPHFQGEMALYARPGHIPSASNVSAMALLDESGRYRPRDDLAALFATDRDARVITYCGAGIAASSNAFIMSRLGFTNVAVYIASLQEWAADPANPLVVD